MTKTTDKQLENVNEHTPLKKDTPQYLVVPVGTIKDISPEFQAYQKALKSYAKEESCRKALPSVKVLNTFTEALNDVETSQTMPDIKKVIRKLTMIAEIDSYPKKQAKSIWSSPASTSEASANTSWERLQIVLRSLENQFPQATPLLQTEDSSCCALM